MRAAARRWLRAPVAHALRTWDRRVRNDVAFPLAVCAIFRDEAPFLREWIEFHRGVGVSHFLLYDNGSVDDFGAVLDPFIAEGLVTLVDWPRAELAQLPAYRDGMRRLRRRARWVALIDIDEFLFSPRQVGIVDILDGFEDAPGIHVWHAYYGSSGHHDRPAGPLLEAFTLRAPTTITTLKTIVNPRLVRKVGIHLTKFWRGESVDTARRRAGEGAEPVLDLLRINHYWSRSLADLEGKIRRGDASTTMPRDPEWHRAYERQLNAVRDEAIVSIARAIRGRQASGGPSGPSP